MADRTRISTDIDFEAPGKQIGYLRLPHSDNNHPFGVVPIPIAVLKGAQGPTVLLVGGTHGDEYEGQVILRSLIHEMSPDELVGRLIVIPAANYLAAQSGTRCWPDDGINMNRAYPGSADVTPTPALAHYIESQILPRCDYGVDLHSGGMVGEFLPCVYLRKSGDAAFMQRKLALCEAFSSPLTVVVGKTSDNRSLIAAGDRCGVPMIATELAGMGSISVEALRIGRRGVRGVLESLGLIAGNAQTPSPSTRYVECPDAKSFVIAEFDGLFEPCVTLGAQVAAGDLAGRVHSHRSAALPSAEVHFSTSGLVVARRVPARMGFGDYLFTVARDVERSQLES